MRAALALLAPPSIWAVHFFALYGPVALFCSRGGEDRYAFYAVTVSAIAAAMLIGFAFFRVRAGMSAEFLDRVALLMSLLALCAVVWAALAAVILPACGA